LYLTVFDGKPNEIIWKLTHENYSFFYFRSFLDMIWEIVVKCYFAQSWEKHEGRKEIVRNKIEKNFSLLYCQNGGNKLIKTEKMNIYYFQLFVLSSSITLTKMYTSSSPLFLFFSFFSSLANKSDSYLSPFIESNQ
jgi:hypothetical protein